jgi:hypothetical protein
VRVRNAASRHIFAALCDLGNSAGGWARISDADLASCLGCLGNLRTRFKAIRGLTMMPRAEVASLCNSVDALTQLVGVGEKVAMVVLSYLRSSTSCVVVDSRALTCLNALGLIHTTGGTSTDRRTFPRPGWAKWTSAFANAASRTLRGAEFDIVDHRRTSMFFSFSITLNRLGAMGGVDLMDALNRMGFRWCVASHPFTVTQATYYDEAMSKVDPKLARAARWLSH